MAEHEAAQTSAPANRRAPSVRPLISEITCEAVTEWSALEPLREEWDETVARAGGDIYFTYDWCRTWWRHYGKPYQLCVLLFRRDRELVSLLPMMIDRIWLGPIRLKLAKLLGTERTTVVVTPPVAEECAETVYKLAMQYLLEQERCDGVRLGPLSGETRHRELIREACAAEDSCGSLVRDCEMDVTLLVRLADSYEGYLESLPSKYRSNMRRIRKRFESEHKADPQIIDDASEAEAAFGEFVEMHQSRWESEGQLGHFGDFPRAEAFNRDLIRTLGPMGRVMMSRLCVEGMTISCEYNFVFDNVLYARLPARRMGEPWEHLHVARLSMLYLFDACIQRGIHTVALGSGSSAHKREMGGVEVPMVSMVIAAKRPWATFKVSKLLWLYWCGVNLAYQRVWCRKITPRLPRMFRRPLWSLWMRLKM